jgi:signal transduction histidine kinase
MDVLVVEDDQFSRLLLEKLLVSWNMRVVLAEDGQEALEVLSRQDAPRMVLADWMMPRLDGPALCRALRDRPNGTFTYVILLTSKSDKQDIIEGLESGAHDFLTKPVEPSQLRSRLGVGIRILQYENALAKKTAELEAYGSAMHALAEERARQLVHADRIATLGLMSAGLAHEIKQPTASIAGNVHMLRSFWETIEPGIRQMLSYGVGEPQQLDFILEETPSLLDELRAGVERITTIISNLSRFSRRDSGGVSSLDLNNCIEQALRLCANALKKKISVELQLETGLPTCPAVAQQIEQVLVNLFLNAADAIDESPVRILSISTSFDEKYVRAKVRDTGPGIPIDKLESIWQPFFTTKGIGKGTGLGLSISRDIVQQHLGQLFVENNEGSGACFTLELPRMKLEAGSER